MLLTGKTVLVVEAEPFAAYALERRLRDLDADHVIVVRDPDDARLRMANGWGEEGWNGVGDMTSGTSRGGSRPRRPGLAIIDFDDCGGSAQRLADDLRRRRIKVVRTTRDEESRPSLHAARKRLPSALPTVRKPYDMIEIERAIGRHYGVLI